MLERGRGVSCAPRGSSSKQDIYSPGSRCGRDCSARRMVRAVQPHLKSRSLSCSWCCSIPRPIPTDFDTPYLLVEAPSRAGLQNRNARFDSSVHRSGKRPGNGAFPLSRARCGVMTARGVFRMDPLESARIDPFLSLGLSPGSASGRRRREDLADVWQRIAVECPVEPVAFSVGEGLPGRDHGLGAWAESHDERLAGT